VSDKINITLNGETLAVDADHTILDVARKRGIFIPTLCHNDLVEPFASCFLCVVEMKGRPNLIPSCSTKVTEGMDILTETDRVTQARRTCIELLLSDHVGDCLGPCMSTCPAGVDIPGFVAHVAKGEFEQAFALIKSRLPLPGVLGRICTRPCETACRRQLVDEPIAICQLKRAVADATPGAALAEKAACTGKKVAVVGAGPAGLTCAYYLQLLGHDCTVIDAHEAPGGMMRYGIPSFRLPRHIIDEEAEVIRNLGATFRFNTRLGRDVSLAQLQREFDAVFLGIGAQKATAMGVPGEDLDGVLSGIGFLGEASRNESMPIGKRVMVVGGGNTAIDASRTALRLGADEVCILYRRTRNEMPAWEEEISAAEHEGVRLEILAAPVKIEKRSDGTLAVSCIRMDLGEPDASGRRRPVPIEGSEHVRIVDNVIAAIGQSVAAEAAEGMKLSRWGSIEVNPDTLQSAASANVFSGGDCVSGADIAVTAVGAGRRAAVAMDQFLMGRPVVSEPRPYNHMMGELKDVPRASYDKFPRASRVPMPHLEAKARAKNFGEVETGFTQEMARKEAERCMACGCRDAYECRLREYAGLFGASQRRFEGVSREYCRDESHEQFVHESSKCIQCGTCVRIADKLLGTAVMGFVNRGFTASVKPALGRPLGKVNHAGLERLVDSCPTGALTRKSEKIAVLSSKFERPKV
jgi:NADPH-dependent glutamate synthase beta subunit-like oxidoreductase